MLPSFCLFHLVFISLVAIISGSDSGSSLELAYAISQHDLVKVKSIIQDNNLLVNTPINTGDGLMAPLHRSILTDDFNITELLLKQGALVELIDDNGRNVLSLSTFHNSSVEFVKLLINHSNQNLHFLLEQKAYDGKTALHYAIENFNLETVEALLAAGSRPDGADSNRCNEPLFFATALKNKIPLKICRQSLDERNYFSCRSEIDGKFSTIVSVLLEAGSNPAATDPCTGLTPIGKARLNNDRFLLRVFGVEKATNSLKSMDKSQYETFPEFETFPEKRCSGKSHGGPIDIRMIPVQQCAAACSKMKDCYGFNLMVMASSGTRGSGCIVKTSECQLQADPHYIFYKTIRGNDTKSTTESTSSTVNTISVSNSGAIVLPTSTIGSVNSDGYLPKNQFNWPVSNDNKAPTLERNFKPLFPQQSPIVPNQQPPSNVFYQSPPQQQPQPFFPQHPNNIQSRPIPIEHMEIPGSEVVNDCGSIAWYSWLIIGICCGVVFTGTLAFFLRNCRGSRPSTQLTNLSGLRNPLPNYHEDHHDHLSQNKPIENPWHVDEKNSLSGTSSSLAPVSSVEKDKISTSLKDKRMLSISPTTCWSLLEEKVKDDGVRILEKQEEPRKNSAEASFEATSNFSQPKRIKRRPVRSINRERSGREQLPAIQKSYPESPIRLAHRVYVDWPENGDENEKQSKHGKVDISPFIGVSQKPHELDENLRRSQYANIDDVFVGSNRAALQAIDQGDLDDFETAEAFCELHVKREQQNHNYEARISNENKPSLNGSTSTSVKQQKNTGHYAMSLPQTSEIVMANDIDGPKLCWIEKSKPY